jgi:Flp pilus assembly pilin Flp
MSRLLLKGSHAIRERLTGRHSDRGAGFVEYAGLLLLIAAVVVAVVALDIPTQVADAVRDAVGDIL